MKIIRRKVDYRGRWVYVDSSVIKSPGEFVVPTVNPASYSSATGEMLHELRNEHPKKSEIPQVKDLHAMIHALGKDILGAIIRYHVNNAGESVHGVPDLFLYTRRMSDGTIARYQFV